MRVLALVLVVVTSGCIAARGPLTRDTLRTVGPERASYVHSLQQRARELHISTSRQWLRLGHWRDGWITGYTSEADGQNFFLSPDGKESPQAELDATIAAFFTELAPYVDDADHRSIQHPICQFPARFRYLSRALQLDATRLPAHDCARFEEFASSINADSVTLVFSSYYVSKPASAFGHTFLRIGKKSALVPEDARQLLDYGIDYSADPDTTFVPIYAIKGLAGAFPGTYRKVPFYFKVRQYNDFESRDLWEYKLKLSSDELAMAIAHIWELGSTFFRYFYLSENCSYHILSVIEAAAPRLDLLDRLNWPVIPADTIKALFRNKELVQSIEFRPSSRTRLWRVLDELDSGQRDAVARIAEDPSSKLTLPERQQITVIDAAQDLVDLRFAKQMIDATKGGKGPTLKQQLLERRAQILVPSQEVAYEPPWSKMPQRGHGSHRFMLGAGFASDDRQWVGASARLALHDLADPADGYPELAQLEFLPTRVNYEYPGRRPRLEQLDLVHIVSLTSQNRFDRHMSWEFRLGSERLHDDGCPGCYAAHVEIGGGATVASARERIAAFVLASTNVWAGPDIDGLFSGPVRLGIGPVGGLRLRFSSRMITLLRSGLMWLPAQPNRFSTLWTANATVRWLVTPGFALDLDASALDSTVSGVASSVLYF